MSLLHQKTTDEYSNIAKFNQNILRQFATNDSLNTNISAVMMWWHILIEAGHWVRKKFIDISSPDPNFIK